jgi:serine/threonine protein phosphatase PrpC
MALVDTAHEDLYVAVTGDCRAVSGSWEQTPQGGKWHVDVLTEDQTAKNPSEVKKCLDHTFKKAKILMMSLRLGYFQNIHPTRHRRLLEMVEFLVI